jgi:hypothetical protein
MATSRSTRGIVGAVDLAHAAFADQGLDGIDAELVAFRQSIS